MSELNRLTFLNSAILVGAAALEFGMTIASATTSYHLSLPTPTDAQKNLITLLNTATGTGAAAIFGLLNDDDE